MGFSYLPDELLLPIMHSLSSRKDLANWRLASKRFAALCPVMQCEFPSLLVKLCISECIETLQELGYALFLRELTRKLRLEDVSLASLALFKASLELNLLDSGVAVYLGRIVSNRYCQAGKAERGIWTLELTYEYVGTREFMWNSNMLQQLRSLYEREDSREELSLILNREFQLIKLIVSISLKRIINSSQEQGSSTLATSLTEEMLHVVSNRVPPANPFVHAWAECLVGCYERDGRHNEAKKLTRGMFDKLDNCLPPTDSRIQVWAERLANYDEKDDHGEEATKLRQWMAKTQGNYVAAAHKPAQTFPNVF